MNMWLTRIHTFWIINCNCKSVSFKHLISTLGSSEYRCYMLCRRLKLLFTQIYENGFWFINSLSMIFFPKKKFRIVVYRSNNAIECSTKENKYFDFHSKFTSVWAMKWRLIKEDGQKYFFRFLLVQFKGAFCVEKLKLTLNTTKS